MLLEDLFARKTRAFTVIFLGNSKMPDPELIELRASVDCRTVLEHAGWQLDKRETHAALPKTAVGRA